MSRRSRPGLRWHGVNAEVTIRPAVRADAAELAALFAAQREHLAPWDPRREPGFFTRGGQRARLTAGRARPRGGHRLPLPDPRGRRARRRGLDHERRAALVPEREPRLLGRRRALRARRRRPRPSPRSAASRSASSSCTASRPARCCTTSARRSCSTATASRPFGVAASYLRIAGSLVRSRALPAHRATQPSAAARRAARWHAESRSLPTRSSALIGVGCAGHLQPNCEMS